LRRAAQTLCLANVKTNNSLPSLPLFQTSGSTATLRLCGATIDIVRCPSRTSDNRDRFAYAITLPDGSEYHSDDLRSGCGGCTMQEAAESLLSFLSACGESVGYGLRTGRTGENEDLFPPAVGEWCYGNSDEIAFACMELRGENE
jgi:hypothetical protein